MRLDKSEEHMAESRRRGGFAKGSHAKPTPDVYIRKHDIRAEVRQEDEERRRAHARG